MSEPIKPSRGVGYPPPISAPTHPYSNPRDSNPTLAGLLLKVLSGLVANVGAVQSVLWDNANFYHLRTLETRGILDRYLPRFDPTVIPTTFPAPPPSIEPAESNVFNSAAAYTSSFAAGDLTPTDVTNRLLPLLTSKQSSHSLCIISPVATPSEPSTSRYRSSAAYPSGLDGVPILVKDEFSLAGTPRTMGLTMAEMHRRGFAKDEEGQTSWCVEKLIEAGSLIVGKANMHEIGFDTTNNNPNWGTPRNPYNSGFYTGGSSGGCAYAVSSGLCVVGVGADGGGSIRLPSSYCGVYGLKPTHGRVSSRPTLSIAPSNGVAGPIAATMPDLELAYRIMAAPDPENPVSVLFPTPTKPPAEAQIGRRILGIYRPWFEDCDTEVREIVSKAVKWLEDEAGYQVVDVEIPYVTEGRIAHAITILTEIGQGFCKGDATGLTPANKMLVGVSNKTPAKDFNIAQKVRSLLMSHLSSLFDAHSDSLIIVSPVTPHIGVKIASESHVQIGGAGLSDTNTSLKSMQYVYLANFTGCPGISVPAGYSVAEGMPVGLMGMAAWGGEEVLLEFGKAAEKYLCDVVGRKKGTEGGKGGEWVDLLAQGE